MCSTKQVPRFNAKKSTSTKCKILLLKSYWVGLMFFSFWSLIKIKVWAILCSVKFRCTFFRDFSKCHLKLKLARFLLIIIFYINFKATNKVLKIKLTGDNWTVRGLIKLEIWLCISSGVRDSPCDSCVINTDLYKIKYLLTYSGLLHNHFDFKMLRFFGQEVPSCLNRTKHTLIKKSSLQEIFLEDSLQKSQRRYLLKKNKYVHWPLCWSEPNNLISRQPYSSQENSRRFYHRKMTKYLHNYGDRIVHAK